MNFGILGPLEASLEDRPVPLGGGRQCALLAVLLLRPNEVVPTERLLEELWGEASPATARKVVQLYVSRLRKRLGDGVLLTRTPGYILRVDPDGLDADRFEGLVQESRRALAAQDPSLAAAMLREALALWRGPALADFLYEPFAQQAIVRLEELRLAALEARIDADLALGRHAELVGELEALVAAHPVREHPRSQLMLALYRSGRQAEALAAYQQARNSLVTELGLEPSLALQRLERLRAAVEIAGQISDRWALSNASACLAAVVCEQGRHAEALHIIDTHDAPPAIFRPRRQATSALALAGQGHLTAAEPLAQEAVALYEQTDCLHLHGGALMVLAEVLRIAGRSTEAARVAENALRVHERKGNLVSAEKARALLSGLAAST